MDFKNYDFCTDIWFISTNLKTVLLFFSEYRLSLYLISGWKNNFSKFSTLEHVSEIKL